MNNRKNRFMEYFKLSRVNYSRLECKAKKNISLKNKFIFRSDKNLTNDIYILLGNYIKFNIIFYKLIKNDIWVV